LDAIYDALASVTYATFRETTASIVRYFNSFPHIILPTPEELAKKLFEFESEIVDGDSWEELGTEMTNPKIEAASRLLTWMREQR